MLVENGQGMVKGTGVRKATNKRTEEYGPEISWPSLRTCRDKMKKYLFPGPWLLAFVLLAACTSAYSPPPDPTVLPTPRPRRLQPGELELAADSDAIPAIFASPELFVDAVSGSQEWPDDEPVIGLRINDAARAYPVRLLSLHEIVNDELDNVPIAVTWCPLCYTALVFDRRLQGQELTFGVSGYLYYNNLVMYDHQSNTLWSQVLAQGLRGPKRGQMLEMIPALLSTWGAWKEAHPHTTLLSARQMGLQAGAIIDPYAAYYVSGASGLGGREADSRLPPKTLVVGVRIGNASRACPVAAVRASGQISDTLGGVPILLVYDRQLQTVLVYRGHEAQAEQRLPAPLVFWFAWADLYPDTDLVTLEP